MIHILIADDHAIVREGLKQIVTEEPDIKVIGEAENASQVFELLQSLAINIIILDINMPGKSGLEALKDLRKDYPKIPVLILSMYSEEQYGLRALKAGASGFLKKVSAPEELVKAIRKIFSGGKYISPELAEKLADNFEDNRKALRHEQLSNRELQIMCEIGRGKTAEEMAEDLSISIHTVYSYRNRILDKMKLKSNVELTQYVIKNKLIEV